MQTCRPTLGVVTGSAAFAGAALWLLCVATLLLVTVQNSQAQDDPPDPLIPTSSITPMSKVSNPKKHKDKRSRSESSPNPAPAASIPVSPLGFSPPSAFYLGERLTHVSLGFLDEDHLLFTFRVPGLISREPDPAPGPTASPDSTSQSQTSQSSGSSATERRIRAIVLAIPSGQVTAEALWTLHDYGPYLWTLKDRTFLLRDRNELQIGDASLQLQPYLRFPGSVRTVEFDPAQQLLAVNSTEPLPAKPSAVPASDPKPQADTQNILRILSMVGGDQGKVLSVNRVSGMPHLPIDGEGYYDALRGKGSNWLIAYEYMSSSGGTEASTLPVGMVESTCSPSLDVIASGVVLASGCSSSGDRDLVALRRDPNPQWASPTGGARESALSAKKENEPHRLWQITAPATQIWPLLAYSAHGQRFARSTLEVTHPVNARNPIDTADLRTQNITVYDLATGKIPLTVQASPVLDGGGNFALSPAGTRLAVLNSGNIQIYDLDAPPPMPAGP